MPENKFENGRHYVSYRVYYEDTDAGGVVYHANFLRFAERARSEALRLLGVAQGSLREGAGLGFVVRRCEIDYLKPGRLDDEITVETTLHEIGKASMSMQHLLIAEDRLLARMRVIVVCVGPEFKPAAIPDDMKRRILEKLPLQPLSF